MIIPSKKDFEKYNNVALLQKAEDANGVIFGTVKTQEPNDENVLAFRMDSKQKLNQNIALLGGSGTKEAEDFIRVQCFQAAKRNESVVLNDPGGRFYNDLAQFFEEEGYEVRCLNLLHSEESDGWNILPSLWGPGVETRVQFFVDMIMKSTGNGREDVHTQGCRSLLNALILKVFLSNDFQEDERNFHSLCQLLQHPGGAAFLDGIFDPDIMPLEERPCLGPYVSYKNCESSGLRGEIIMDLSARLGFMQEEQILNLLSRDGIDLELPGKKKSAYFISYSEEHNVYKPILSVFFSLLLTKLSEYASTQGQDGKLYVPVNFFLSSIESIGCIDPLDSLIPSLSRKAINLIFSVQTLNQLKQTYPRSWQTLLANCSTRMFFGSNDPETRAYIQGVNGKALSCNDNSYRRSIVMTIFDMQSFPHAGALIQARRKELSLSQENVADRIGISAKALSKIETGKNSLSSEHIQPLSGLLFIPAHVLLEYVEPSLCYGQEPYYYDGQKYSITCDLTEETIRETIHQIKSEYFHEFLENPRRNLAWYKTRRDFLVEALRFAMDKDGRILFRYYFSLEEFNLLCEIHKIHRIDVSDGFNRRLVRQLADILDKDPRIDNAALEPRDRPNYKDRELFLRGEYLGGHENVSETVFSPIRERILSEFRPDEEKWKEKLREEKEVWEQYISQTTT